jgi:hypothetical protein
MNLLVLHDALLIYVGPVSYLLLLQVPHSSCWQDWQGCGTDKQLSVA